MICIYSDTTYLLKQALDINLQSAYLQHLGMLICRLLDSSSALAVQCLYLSQAKSTLQSVFFSGCLAWVGIMQGWWLRLIIWLVKIICPKLSAKSARSRRKHFRKKSSSASTTPSTMSETAKQSDQGETFNYQLMTKVNAKASRGIKPVSSLSNLPLESGRLNRRKI